MNNVGLDESTSEFNSVLNAPFRSDTGHNILSTTLKNAFSSISQIDTLIGSALLERGINTKIDFAISILNLDINSHIKGEYVQENKKHIPDEILLFGNKERLKDNPNFYFHGSRIKLLDYYELRLYIDYPDLWKYLIFKMRWLIIGITCVTLIISGFFIYTTLTIIKQKKLADIKNDFINNITHELNTPISTIRVAGQNLLKEEIKQNPDLVNDLALTIIRQNKRLQKTVSKVMDASLNDTELINLNLAVSSLHKLLTEITTDFLTTHKDNDVQINHHFNAQNDLIKLDVFYFTSAIFNLLDNATKYNEPPVKIQISTKNTVEKLILKIQDNGIGIPAKDQTLIFDKFYRVAHGNIHGVKGLGLGLYIVKQIVKAHHAQIKLISKTDEGSTFIIEIPYS